MNPIFLRLIMVAAISVVALLSTNARQIHSLNDGWHFAKGEDSTRTAVHLPHCWNSDAYSTRNYYRGIGTYTKTLAIPADFANQRIFLKFDGTAQKAEISIDGTLVSKHIGAYSSHTIDITELIAAGSDHTLKVVVSNSDADIPPYSADFTFMGGLYRDAWLIALPKIHLDITAGPVEGFKVSTAINDAGKGMLAVDGTVVNSDNAKAKATVAVRLYAPDGSVIAQKKTKLSLNASSSAVFTLNLDDIGGIQLWSPESPKLYSVVAEILIDGKVVDSSRSTTAFRTFAFDDEGRFLLNGSPYKLRGMCRHQDQKPMGIALSDEQHRRDMQLIKDMGANFVRISHYPQDDAVLEMCDRMGLIVWEEIPVIDYVPASTAFADNCETMLRDMIRTHYNHPSIAMWGYMNEILLRVPRDGRDATLQRTRELTARLEAVLHEEDANRLSTMAFHGSNDYHPSGLSYSTDVQGWNLYNGWYGGRITDFEQFLSNQHREHPTHKLIVSEYGAGSDLRLHSLHPECFDFSMEYQQMFLEHYLSVVEDSAFVAGSAHWNFIDFSSANRAESMPHINNKGLLTNDRRKKDVYYYFSAKWHDARNKIVAHIATRDWANRTEIVNTNYSYITRPIKVYTNLSEVTLKVNGESLDTKYVKNCSAIFDVKLHNGINVLELASADAQDKILDATSIELNAIAHNGSALDLGLKDFAVNVGSNCYFRSDDSQLTWLPDCEYSDESGYGHIGGKRVVSQDEIKLTNDQPLLQHALVGLKEYRFALVPGFYEVELSFAELTAPSAHSAYMLGHNAGSGSSGVAVMNISINNENVEKDFAPGILSGEKTLVKRRYTARVADDGKLSIKFSPTEGATTLLSAIKIRKFQI